MDLKKKNSYWNWYRKGYVLLWGILSVFYGTRVVRTIQYWVLLKEWGAAPGRWYLLISGVLFFVICFYVFILLIWKKGQALGWVCWPGLFFMLWVWVDQLLFSQIPDRYGNIPFLVAGTLVFAGWTFFVFRKE